MDFPKLYFQVLLLVYFLLFFPIKSTDSLDKVFFICLGKNLRKDTCQKILKAFSWKSPTSVYYNKH